MKKQFFLLLIFFCPFNVYAQNYYTTDELSNMVVCICQSFENNITPCGTAVVINDNEKFYIITASHVIESIKGTCIIAFKGNNDKPILIQLMKLANTKNPIWKKHKEADIACIEIYPGSDEKQYLKSRSISKSHILMDSVAISRDFTITTIGYPAIAVGEYFSPLSFESSFSSGYVTYPRADAKNVTTFQLLKDPSVEGYSGAPVFVGVKKFGISIGPEETFIIGIMHGTYKDNTGGKMAFVTPSYFIRDLLLN